MAAGEIPDPFIGMNERDVQWVDKKDWIYECPFQMPKARPDEHIDLVFEGLDTFAHVTLNGVYILG